MTSKANFKTENDNINDDVIILNSGQSPEFNVKYRIIEKMPLVLELPRLETKHNHIGES